MSTAAETTYQHVVRYDSECAKALPQSRRDDLFGQQMEDLTGLSREAYLSKWYGPKGSPDRQAEEDRERKDAAERSARPGNIDLSGVDTLMAQIEEVRKAAAAAEQALIESHLSNLIKFPAGTVLAVEPQPHKKGLYFCQSERFLVLGYSPTVVGPTRMQPKQLWVDVVGIYLDHRGFPLSAKPQSSRKGKPVELSRETIALNSHVSHLIIGIADNQAHKVESDLLPTA